MLIEIENLCKSYLSEEMETRALRSVSLQIERGDYVAIEGPSGCGKSTLLSIVGLLESPTSGSYRLKGRDVSEATPNERSRIRNREIGFIFQNFNLLARHYPGQLSGGEQTGNLDSLNGRSGCDDHHGHPRPAFRKASRTDHRPPRRTARRQTDRSGGR